MKKIILLFMFLFISCFSLVQGEVNLSDNEIYLDKGSESLFKTKVQKSRVNMNSMDVEYKVNPRKKEYETLLYKDVTKLRPENKSISKSLETKLFGNTSIGASYANNPDKFGKSNDSVSVYSKYQRKYFGFTTSYSQNKSGYNKYGAENGTVSFAPEISLNKYIKLKNIYSENLGSNEQKGELVLSLHPFKNDRWDLDIGAGETFSNGNQGAKSHINFDTKFRF